MLDDLVADAAPVDRLPDPVSDVELDEVGLPLNSPSYPAEGPPTIAATTCRASPRERGRYRSRSGFGSSPPNRLAHCSADETGLASRGRRLDGRVPRRAGLDELVAANARDGAGLDDRVEPLAHHPVRAVVTRRVVSLIFVYAEAAFARISSEDSPSSARGGNSIAGVNARHPPSQSLA